MLRCCSPLQLFWPLLRRHRSRNCRAQQLECSWFAADSSAQLRHLQPGGVCICDGNCHLGGGILHATVPRGQHRRTGRPRVTQACSCQLSWLVQLSWARCRFLYSGLAACPQQRQQPVMRGATGAWHIANHFGESEVDAVLRACGQECRPSELHCGRCEAPCASTSSATCGKGSHAEGLACLRGDRCRRRCAPSLHRSHGCCARVLMDRLWFRIAVLRDLQRKWCSSCVVASFST